MLLLKEQCILAKVVCSLEIVIQEYSKSVSRLWQSIGWVAGNEIKCAHISFNLRFLKDKHEHLQKRHDNLRDYLKKKLSRMKLGCYMSWFRYFIPQTNETYNPSKCLQFDTLPSTLLRHLLIAWKQQHELRKQIPSDNRCLLIKDLMKVRKHLC